MNSEQNLTREEAIAILNTPDEQLNELIERAGALRKKYKGNHVSIHLLTNARSGNCSQNCAYCAQSCRSHADIEKYKWVDDEKLYGDNTFVHDHKLSRHCIGLSGMKFSDEEIEELKKDFVAVEEQVSLFEKVDTEGVEPMVYPFEAPTTFLREDVVSDVLTQEEALKNVKDARMGHVHVPKVVK